MAEKPQVLLFDVGNVLLRLKMDAFLAALAQACPKLDAETMHREMRNPEGFHFAYERGEVTGQQFYAHLQSVYGLTWDYDQWLQHWLDYFLPNHPMESMIAKLRGQARLWALSNTNADHYAAFMKEFRLFGSFEGVLGSQQLGLRKPDPRIYAVALERIKVPAQAVLYVDDLQVNIDAGKATGMRTFRYTFNDLEFKETLKGLGFEVEDMKNRPSVMSC